MRTPVTLLLICLGLAALTLPPLQILAKDLLPIALTAAFAAALLVLRALRRPAKPKPRRRGIMVDGSNLLYWADSTPRLDSVATVLRRLEGHGFTPLVCFDANVGHLVGARYMGPDILAGRLALLPEQVVVANKGTPADPLLLDIATRRGLLVVSNDRFRDWAERFPLVTTPERLVRGGIQNGRANLILPESELATA